MSKRKIIILANAAINNGNRGCLALSYCSIYLIDSILREKSIEYDLYLTDSNVRGIQERSIIIGKKRISFNTCSYPLPFSFQSLLKSIYKISDTKKSWKIFKKADLIFDIGQGDSFADIYGRSRFDLIDKVHRTARLLRKPYVLLPQTIGPFENPTVKKMAYKSINNALFVMARDNISYDYCIKHAPNQKKIKEYIDIAFFLPYTKKQFDKRFIHVGFNISALLWSGGYTKNNQFGLKGDYQELIRSVIQYFLSIPNIKLHLVPHVVDHMRNLENDYALAFDLQKEYGDGRVVLSPLFLSPVDAKDYISGLDFFMGSRMHATIAAYSSGVPVVPMAYSRKFNGLFVDTLSYSTLIDLKEDDNEKAMQCVTHAFHDRELLKSQIQATNKSVVEEKKTLLMNDLAKILLD